MMPCVAGLVMRWRRIAAICERGLPVRLALQIGAVACGAVFGVEPLAERDDGLILRGWFSGPAAAP